MTFMSGKKGNTPHKSFLLHRLSGWFLVVWAVIILRESNTNKKMPCFFPTWACSLADVFFSTETPDLESYWWFVRVFIHLNLVRVIREKRVYLFRAGIFCLSLSLFWGEKMLIKMSCLPAELPSFGAAFLIFHFNGLWLANLTSNFDNGWLFSWCMRCFSDEIDKFYTYKPYICITMYW